jgi:hypothetical protein
MKVYLLHEPQYGSHTIVKGIFSSYEKAEESRDKFIKEFKIDKKYIEIEEYELDND